MPAVTCPTCFSDEIDALGKDPSGDLRLKCEDCGAEWTRTPNRPCPACSSIDVTHTDAAGYACRSCGHGWREVQFAQAPPPPAKAAATRKSSTSRRRSAGGAIRRPSGGAGHRIDQVWVEIERHGGESFRLKSGQDFTYQVSGNVLMPSTANWDVPKSEIHEALTRMPVSGPAQLKDLQASAFIYAILTDSRIAPTWQ